VVLVASFQLGITKLFKNMNFKYISVGLAAVCGNVHLVLEYMLQYEDTVVYCGCETWSLILKDGKV